MSPTEFFTFMGLFSTVVFGTFIWFALQMIFFFWKGEVKASDSFETRLRQFISVKKYPFLFFFGSCAVLFTYWFARIAMLPEAVS